MAERARSFFEVALGLVTVLLAVIAILDPWPWARAIGIIVGAAAFLWLSVLFSKSALSYLIRKGTDLLHWTTETYWDPNTGRFYYGEIANVFVRVRTIQIALSTLLSKIGEPKAQEEILRDAGVRVGRDFAKDLAEQLLTPARRRIFWFTRRTLGTIPRSPVTRELLDLWSSYDGKAGFGKFDFGALEIVGGLPKGRMRLVDSFLTWDSPDDTKNLCRFMEGYIEGFLGAAVEDEADVKVQYSCAGKGPHHSTCDFDVSTAPKTTSSKLGV